MRLQLGAPVPQDSYLQHAGVWIDWQLSGAGGRRD